MESNKQISVTDLILTFNKSEFRKSSIPMELFSGFPALIRLEKTLCMALPYYARVNTMQGIVIYPFYCSAVFAVLNPDKLFDFTVYRYKKECQGISFNKPIGCFKNEEIVEASSKQEYQQLCTRFFNLYSQLINDILHNKQFESEKELSELFSKVIERPLLPHYMQINQKFYSHFCRVTPQNQGAKQ